MSASLDSQSPSKAKEPVLTPKLPPSWALGPAHIAITAVWVMIFLLFSYMPLRSTDLWGHTMWGHWILEHRQLPTEDPFAPLAQGMRVVDSAWLSQVIFATVDRQAGPVGLSAVFAITVLATLLLLARSFYLQSRHVLLMMFGVALVLIVGWSRATTLRPENFAALCFAALIWLVTVNMFGQRASDAANEGAKNSISNLILWLGLPTLFCVWANLHGSYVVGLAFLGCVALGTAIDVGWREKSFAAMFQSPDVQRWVFLAELALLATLINPYGLDLLVYNLTFASNPNLQTILEWQPLVVFGVGGREFALSIVLLLVLWRVSRAPVSAVQVLLLALFCFASLKSVRMIGWYAPVFAWVVMPHLGDLWTRWRIAPSDAPAEPVQPVAADGEAEYELPPGRSFHFTLICGLLLWMGFAFSPVYTLVMGGKSRTEAQLFDKQSSPLKVAEYLAKNPPQGQVFQPQHWGDWLVRRVPGLTPFMTSNMHLVPSQVYADYQRIASAQPGWVRVLDRYDVKTLVLDKELQPIIVQAMKQTTGWALAYEDDQALVYVRTKPSKSDVEPEPSAESLPGGELSETSGDTP